MALVFILAFSLLVLGVIQAKLWSDTNAGVEEISGAAHIFREAVIACGDLDARLLRLEETH